MAKLCNNDNIDNSSFTAITGDEIANAKVCVCGRLNCLHFLFFYLWISLSWWYITSLRTLLLIYMHIITLLKMRILSPGSPSILPLHISVPRYNLLYCFTNHNILYICGVLVHSQNLMLYMYVKATYSEKNAS